MTLLRIVGIALVLLAHYAVGWAPLPTVRHDFHLSMSEASEDGAAQGPQTFREAEVLGLRLMQEGHYEEALKSTCDAACRWDARVFFLISCRL